MEAACVLILLTSCVLYVVEGKKSEEVGLLNLSRSAGKEKKTTASAYSSHEAEDIHVIGSGPQSAGMTDAGERLEDTNATCIFGNKDRDAHGSGDCTGNLRCPAGCQPTCVVHSNIEFSDYGFTPQPFYIENPYTGLVLSIKDESRDEKASVIMYTYRGTKNQLWDHKQGIVISILNGLVLDLCRIKSDANCVFMWRHTKHGVANIKWRFYGDGAVKTDRYDHLFITVQDATTRAGAKVTVANWTGEWHQKFRKVYVAQSDIRRN